jgi:hypothetical protein
LDVLEVPSLNVENGHNPKALVIPIGDCEHRALDVTGRSRMQEAGVPMATAPGAFPFGPEERGHCLVGSVNGEIEFAVNVRHLLAAPGTENWPLVLGWHAADLKESVPRKVAAL